MKLIVHFYCILDTLTCQIGTGIQKVYTCVYEMDRRPLISGGVLGNWDSNTCQPLYYMNATGHCKCSLLGREGLLYITYT